MKAISAEAAKARWMTLLDEVAQDQQEIVITRDGRPVARLVPIPRKTRGQHRRAGVRIVGDIP